MRNVNAEQWAERPWNQPVGRVAMWIRKAMQIGASYTAKQAAKCFYTMLIEEIGEVEARRQLHALNVSVPHWLMEREQPLVAQSQEHAKAA